MNRVNRVKIRPRHYDKMKSREGRVVAKNSKSERGFWLVITIKYCGESKKKEFNFSVCTTSNYIILCVYYSCTLITKGK